MEINPEIFKAYDVRGTYPDQINGEVAYNIGRALAQYTSAKKIVVGHDMRESSEEIEENLIKGINDQGADVIKIGLVSTPMLYFASWNLPGVDAGVIVTASHNPAEYNGMKFCLKDAVPIGEGSGMEEIQDLAIAGNFTQTSISGNTIKDENLKAKYFQYISDFFKTGLGKKRVVVDFANGMGIADKKIYQKFSEDIEAVFMFDDYDGNFPNHEANPLKTETLLSLQKKVIEEKADLGIAYDGDADRIGFADEKGEVVPMDYMIALLAKEVLKSNPGALILMDLRSSNAVKEVIEEAGGKVARCRVGHSLIKKQMREQGAIFAGELSGHYFFQENSKAEMSTLAAIYILNLLGETGKTMSELTNDLKRYYHSGEINSDVTDKQAVMDKLKEIYADGKLDEMDGIRIDYLDWWFNVRPSNTEPKLRLNLEAKTKEMMEQKRDEVLSIIRS
jgi:phosphomannomutase